MSNSETGRNSTASSRPDEAPPPSGERPHDPRPSDDAASESEASGPLLDSAVLPVADSPVFGDPDAPMTIVVFPADDYGPIPDLKQIVRAFGGEVRLVVKHLNASALRRGADPQELLESDATHHREDRMALVLEALRRQDPEVYWPAIRVLAAGRPDFEDHPPEEIGAELAREHGLDVDRYRADLEASATVDAVTRDTELAERLGITGRSTVVFNGEKIGGMYLNPHPIVDLVEGHLDALEELRDDGVEPRRLYRAAVDRRVLDDGTLPKIETPPWDRAEWSLPDIRRIELGSDDPARGPEKAPVTIVQIADLENCIPCALQQAPLENGLNEYADELRVVFKYSPRALDEEYALASRALAAAHRQQRFWDAFRELTDHDRQSDPTERLSPGALADELGLDKEQFQRDLRAEGTTELIEHSADDVRSAGIRVVPSLIVNGLEVLDPDPKHLQKVVERQLEISRRLRDQRGLAGRELREALIEYNEENTEDVWLIE